jgi:hypothetical protein
MGVDILPTELPLESSEHFGKSLLEYVLPDLINASCTFKVDVDVDVDGRGCGCGANNDGNNIISDIYNGSTANNGINNSNIKHQHQVVVAAARTFVDSSKLTSSLKNALITTNYGTFTDKYKYLGKLILF